MSQRNELAVYVGDADNGTEFEVCTARFQLAYPSPEVLRTEGILNKLHVQPA